MKRFTFIKAIISVVIFICPIQASNRLAANLLTLAMKEFPNLQQSERNLLIAVSKGEWLDLRAGIIDIDNPSNAEIWSKERVVRAGVLRWLCVSSLASACVDPKGIRVMGALVKGNLDLSYVQVPFPLQFWHSFFPQGINLQRANVSFFTLCGSRILQLNATGIKVENSIHFNKGFYTEGEVKLLGAVIGGNLECDSGTFTNPNGYALSADHIVVSGSVYLRNEFKSIGEVRFPLSIINGGLDCNQGTFSNKLGDALNVNQSEIKGDVFLRNIKSEGVVNLQHTKIGGNLECSNGNFINPTGYALSAGGIEVNKNVFLTIGFTARGEVEFSSAIIGGQLACIGGTFVNNSGNALNAECLRANTILFRDSLFGAGRLNFYGATVSNIFMWYNFTCPEEIVLDLQYANINILYDNYSSFPSHNSLHLTGLVYKQFDSDAPCDVSTRLKWLRLQPQNEFSTQPYEQLAKVFENSIDSKEAKKVRMEMEKDRGKRMHWFKRLFFRIKGFCFDGYGQDPRRRAWFFIFLAFVIIIVGSFLFRKAFNNNKMLKLKGNLNDNSQNYPNFYCCMYSFDLFIPLINFGHAEFWQPKDKKYLIWYWIQILAGWALSTIIVMILGGYFS